MENDKLDPPEPETMKQIRDIQTKIQKLNDMVEEPLVRPELTKKDKDTL